METITDLGDQWIQNILNKIDTKQKKNRKGVSWLFSLITREIIQTIQNTQFRWKLNYKVCYNL